MINALQRSTALMLVVAAVLATGAAQAPVKKQEVVVTKASGGSIQTKLAGNIVVNQESTVTREWIALHDPAMPVDLVGTPGVTTAWVPDRGRGEYQYQAAVSVQTKEALAAVEVRFLIFDIWGQHIRNLMADEVVDMPASSTRAMSPAWRVLSENEVSRHYASIAYVSRARTQDGRVFEADPAAVVREAQRFSKKFSAADLESKPEPK
jgi:hypothetical protein